MYTDWAHRSELDLTGATALQAEQDRRHAERDRALAAERQAEQDRRATERADRYATAREIDEAIRTHGANAVRQAVAALELRDDQ